MVVAQRAGIILEGQRAEIGPCSMLELFPPGCMYPRYTLLPKSLERTPPLRPRHILCQTVSVNGPLASIFASGGLSGAQDFGLRM